MASETKVTSGNQLKEEVAATAEATKANAMVEVKPAGTLAEKFFAPQDMQDMAGMGAEEVKATDVLLPRLTILQPLSPQLNKKKVEYIEGAEVGDFCDVAVGEIFRGEVDLLPCYFITQYLEWKKNRGGFVKNHGSSALCIKDLPIDDKRRPTLPDGNIIMETGTWYCLIRVGSDWRRIFYPMSSTALQVSRKWHTLIKAEKLFGPSGPFTPPLFYRPWRLTVKMSTNEQGDWFTPVPSKIELTEEQQVGQRVPLNKFANIYTEMAAAQDVTEWLLGECKAFYVDARDGIAVGDISADDLNDPANARVVNGETIDDKNKDM